MELLEKVLIAIGGGAVALVALLAVFKPIFMRFFEKSINATFDKHIEKYRNQLSRASTAYEALLKKEFEFYSKVDHHLATLAPLVQDLVYCLHSHGSIDKAKRRESFKKYFSIYLKIIREMKEEIWFYQPYIPSDIFKAVTDLIVEMQNGLDFWKGIIESLYGSYHNDVDVTKANEISHAVLEHISLIENAMKKYLTDLSQI